MSTTFSDPGNKFAIRNTVIYIVFGLLLVLYLSKFSGDVLLEGCIFLALTAFIFFFLMLYAGKAIADKPGDKESSDAVYRNEISKLKNELGISEVGRKKSKLHNEVKTQFLSNMSQEIRTPMSGIIGMTELMMLTNPTKEQKEYLDIINFSSSTLLAIINDILDFSRIESGKLKLERVDFSIGELIHKTSQILEFDAKKKNIPLKLNIPAYCNYSVIGDPLRVNQILINLLKNALKFTEKGEIELKLDEISKDENKVWLRFTVKDTGIGMSADKLEKLFGDVNAKETSEFPKEFQYKGTGLGTALVKHLVGFMNGKLKVTSKENEGTWFVIDIPFDLSATKERTAPAIKTETAKPPAGQRVNVLVAEDNVVNQRLVRELLTRRNYDVTIVENGLKIFDVLEHSAFDIILMDIQMPIMDGLEATSIIREIEKGTGKHTPIIGITAYSVKADKDKCLAAGMDDYLAKPFIKEDFYLIIEKYVKKEEPN